MGHFVRLVSDKIGTNRITVHVYRPMNADFSLDNLEGEEGEDTAIQVGTQQ